ncbi:hypothetical protein [Kineosporia succinea]|uniref:GAF domain-containing protein n=1 Tax=Kineosporia succinea TaxID=84632 RepID=A0ABT9P8Z1_9ACTN|nr:hypothetical protein [Kineosporia succinea]MDP9829166.1 hypothetical protein [Kineosporia succinea]
MRRPTGRFRGLLFWAGYLVPALLAMVFVLWPVHLARWIGRAVTGDDGSQLTVVLSWSLMAGWVTFLVMLVSGLVRQGLAHRRAGARRDRSEAAVAELEAVRQEKHRHTEAMAMLQALRRGLTGGLGLDGAGRLTFSGCALVEPRAAHRGGAPSPTVVDRDGRVELTRDTIDYVHDDRHVTWSFRNLESVIDATEFLGFVDSDHEGVSGIVLPTPFRPVFLFAIDVRRRNLVWSEEVRRRFGDLENELVDGLERCRVREAGATFLPV